MSKEKEETGLSTKVDEQALAELRNMYPTEATFNRILLPRLGMASQDVTEKQGKNVKIITSAGTFFTERASEKEGKDGKKIFTKKEIGESIEGVILFERRQLRYYDEGTEKYTSSPVFDADDQVIPLFMDNKKIDEGTAKELQGRKQYKGTTLAGKPKSNLEENKILYVLVDEEVYQLSLRGTSMYAYQTYRRNLNKKGLLPPAVLTLFGSDAQKKGKIEWNQMTFEVVKSLSPKEFESAFSKVRDIKESVEAEKAFFASKTAATAEEDADDEDDKEEDKDW